MERVLSEGVLSEGVLSGGGFVRAPYRLETSEETGLDQNPTQCVRLHEDSQQTSAEGVSRRLPAIYTHGYMQSIVCLCSTRVTEAGRRPQRQCRHHR